MTCKNNDRLCILIISDSIIIIEEYLTPSWNGSLEHELRSERLNAKHLDQLKVQPNHFDCCPSKEDEKKVV